jgi:hypothetical protein
MSLEVEQAEQQEHSTGRRLPRRAEKKSLERQADTTSATNEEGYDDEIYNRQQLTTNAATVLTTECHIC